MATRSDFTIDAGATLRVELELTSNTGEILNLDGYTAESQMRKHYTSSNSHAFTCEISADTIVVLSMTANQTANIISGRYVYDVELTHTSTGVVSRVMEGVVTVSPNVTR